MNREELIYNAAFDYNLTTTDESDAAMRGFSAGAQWADANRWVKVEDGCDMPEDGQEVWCVRDFSKWTKNKPVRIDQGYFHIAKEDRRHGGPVSLVPPGIIPKGKYFWSFPCIEPPEVVTHWMPIPEPPKAEQ